MSPPQETSREQPEKEKQGILLLVDVLLSIQRVLVALLVAVAKHLTKKKRKKKGNSEEKGFILSNGLRGNTVHHGQEAQWPECEGGEHIVSLRRKQVERNNRVQVAFSSFFFQEFGLQPVEQCYVHLWWIFPLQLKLSGYARSNTTQGAPC